MTVDVERVRAAVAEIVAALGVDPDQPVLAGTPRRVADAYAELFAGVGVDPAEGLRAGAESASTEDLVLLRDLSFRSMCAHHLLPFSGVAHIGYLPDQQIVGFGRLTGALETVAARPQLQEWLGDGLADAIEAALVPRGVIVVLEARHSCLADRGRRSAESSVVTVASRGALADPVARSAAIALIGSER